MTCWPRIDYYEPAVNYALRKLIQSGMTVFDVGANEGILSVVSSRATGPSGKVIAFEGSPRTMQGLYTNLSDNHVVNVHVVDSYVSDQHNGIVPIYYRAPSTGVADSMIGTSEEVHNASAWVKTVRLDHFIEETGLNPDIIKVDVEGAESLVMTGLEKYFARGKRPLIILEALGACESYEILSAYGYVAFDVHAMRPLSKEEALSFYGNILFYEGSLVCPLPSAQDIKYTKTYNGLDYHGSPVTQTIKSRVKSLLRGDIKPERSVEITTEIQKKGDYLIDIQSSENNESMEIARLEIYVANYLTSLHCIPWKDLLSYFRKHPINLEIDAPILIRLHNCPTYDFSISLSRL